MLLGLVTAPAACRFAQLTLKSLFTSSGMVKHGFLCGGADQTHDTLNCEHAPPHQDFDGPEVRSLPKTAALDWTGRVYRSRAWLVCTLARGRLLENSRSPGHRNARDAVLGLLFPRRWRARFCPRSSWCGHSRGASVVQQDSASLSFPLCLSSTARMLALNLQIPRS